MKSHIFDSFDFTAIIEILYNFELRCDTHDINESAAIWVFQFLKKKLASALLNTTLAKKHKSQTRMQSCGKIATLATNPQVVNYLSCNYATDENISYTKDETTMFIQSPNKTPSQYAEESVSKAHHCGEVYGKHNLNEFFIKELDMSIRPCIRCY